jgi:hypothetical protein
MVVSPNSSFGFPESFVSASSPQRGECSAVSKQTLSVLWKQVLLTLRPDVVEATGSEIKLEFEDTESSLADELFSVLSLNAATDFPPRRVGTPVLPKALVPAARVAEAAVPPVAAIGGLIPESLDVVEAPDARFSCCSAFAAFSSRSRAFTFSNAAARKEAIFSVVSVDLAPAAGCSFEVTPAAGCSLEVVVFAPAAATDAAAVGGFNFDGDPLIYRHPRAGPVNPAAAATD